MPGSSKLLAGTWQSEDLCVKAVVLLLKAQGDKNSILQQLLQPKMQISETYLGFPLSFPKYNTFLVARPARSYATCCGDRMSCINVMIAAGHMWDMVLNFIEL